MNSRKKIKSRSNLNDDTYDYYKRIDAILQEREGTNEAKGELIDNMFSQLAEEAMKVCQSPQTSPIIERIVPQAACENVRSLLDIFVKDWESFCKDQCSSHVAQNLILVIPKFVAEMLKDFDFENAEDSSDESHLILTILKLSEYFLENLEEVITHQHMSHVFRSFVQVLGGTCIGEAENIQKSRASRQYGKHHRDGGEQRPSLAVRFDNYEVPPTFMEKLKLFNKKMFDLSDFGLYLTNSTANPVVQTLLLVLHKVDLDLCQKAIHKVIKHSRIKDSGNNDNLPPVVADNVGSFLMQKVVSLCSEELFTELHGKLFKGKLLQFATHHCANFVLQTLIKACKWKDIFREVVDELAECLDEVIAARYYGIIVSVAETAEKLSCKQDQFIQMLMKGFHCLEPVERQVKFATLVATCTPYDTFFGRRPEDTDSRPRLMKLNYHGSLLLQHLLRFTNTKVLETSLLDLEPGEIVSMSCDPCGSHVIEAFFKSSSLKAKSKEGLMNKMSGAFVQLACNKNGSRSLEAMWASLEVKHKSMVAKELCQQEAKVKSDMFGRHIHRNFALFHFSKRNSEWASVQKNDLRKRQMFKDLLDTTEPSAKKKKKNKKKKQT